MQNFMERTNIANFAERLKTETNSVKRALLIKLLAEEEAKQAMLRTVNRPPSSTYFGRWSNSQSAPH